MTRIDINANEDRIAALLVGLQGGNEFERMCRHNTVVVVSGSDKRCGIRCFFNVMQGRVFVKAIKFLFVLAQAIINRSGPSNGEEMITQHIKYAHSWNTNLRDIGPLCHYRANE
jgi:hypothetical protein